jgi:hypothetical protein
MPARARAVVRQLLPTAISKKLMANFKKVEAPRETGVVRGKSCTLARRTAAYSIGPESKVYRYSGKTRPHSQCSLTSAGRNIERLARRIEKLLEGRQTFNTAILTYYPGKEEGKSPTASKNGLPWHDDLTRTNLVPGSCVASVVFGEARKVSFRSKDDKQAVQTYAPSDGQCYVFKEDGKYQHRVHCGDDERISITFRTVKE